MILKISLTSTLKTSKYKKCFETNALLLFYVQKKTNDICQQGIFVEKYQITKNFELGNYNYYITQTYEILENIENI